MKELKEYTHGFKVNVPTLLDETIDNGLIPNCKTALRIPLGIFKQYLCSVAERAAEINDPILNRLMVEMAMYEVANPYSDEYDSEVVSLVIAKGANYIKNIKNNETTKNKSGMPSRYKSKTARGVG